jgi:YD repeat-containing protein
VACIQGKTKTKGIAERVSGMKQEKEKIDLLLERNAAEQLDRFDWDELGATISRRLNQADRSKTSAKTYRRVFKTAAGVTAAAAVVFIVVMVRTDTPTTVRLENGQRAVVKFVESKGSATVEIHDSKGQDNQSSNRSSWIIIRTRESKVADNGQSRDEADFACLM